MRPVLTPLVGVDVIATAALQNQAVTGAKIANNTITDTQLATDTLEGWNTVTLQNGWATAPSSLPLRFKRFGNMVFLCGALSGTGRSSQTVSTGAIPVGMRPSAWARAIVAAGTANNELTVDQNGTITAGVAVTGFTAVNMFWPI